MAPTATLHCGSAARHLTSSRCWNTNEKQEVSPDRVKSKLKHKHLRRNTNNYNGTLVELHFRSCTYLDLPGVKAGVHASVTCFCWGKGAVPNREWRDAVQNRVELLRVQSKRTTIIASKKTSVFFWYGFRIFLVIFRNKVVFQWHIFAPFYRP